MSYSTVITIATEVAAFGRSAAKLEEVGATAS
jgi:hypothetical protein